MKILLRALVFASLVFSASQTHAGSETYKIDTSHSSVGFTVRHFFTKVPGLFGSYEGTIVVDRENLEKSRVEAVIKVPSINTNSEKRDQHLLGVDFFLAEKFPVISFKSKAWKKTGDNTFDVTGDITMKDITKEVVLKVTSLGFGPGMKGAYLSGWEATATIDRRDFGLNYGQGVVGNEVDITINVEAVLQK